MCSKLLSPFLVFFNVNLAIGNVSLVVFFLCYGLKWCQNECNIFKDKNIFFKDVPSSHALLTSMSNLTSPYLAISGSIEME